MAAAHYQRMYHVCSDTPSVLTDVGEQDGYRDENGGCQQSWIHHGDGVQLVGVTIMPTTRCCSARCSQPGAESSTTCVENLHVLMTVVGCRLGNERVLPAGPSAAHSAACRSTSRLPVPTRQTTEERTEENLVTYTL